MKQRETLQEQLFLVAVLNVLKRNYTIGHMLVSIIKPEIAYITILW